MEEEEDGWKREEVGEGWRRGKRVKRAEEGEREGYDNGDD